MKILLIRFSSIGDIVLTSPVIRMLKAQLPGVSLHFLTKPQFRGLVEHHPGLDQVHVLKESIFKTWLEVRRISPDIVIDLHGSLRSRMLCLLLQRKTYHFSKLNFRKWLLVRFGIHRLPPVHLVDRYIQALGPLGIKDDGLGLDYYSDPSEALSEISLPEGYLKTGFIALAIGAQHFTKRMPALKMAGWVGKLPLPVVLLGGKEDAEAGRCIEIAGSGRIFNGCGKFSIPQSARIMQQSQMVITHDTGMMHIAAALGKNILSIWGSTVPAFGMYPYRPGRLSFRSEVLNLSCRPCSKIGHKQCPKGHFRCMEDQSAEGILEMVEKMLAEKKMNQAFS